jgi:hypothetical protein
VLLVGGGLGNAVLFSIGAAFRVRGPRVLYFAGHKLMQDRYKVAEIEHAADCVVWCCDEAPGFVPGRPQDRAFVDNIVEAIDAYGGGALGPVAIPLSAIDRIIAIGSDGMMAAVAEARQAGLKRYFHPDHRAIASINSPMQCMMKEICVRDARGLIILLMPTKMGGGTYAVNLNTGRCLAWISYWPYGDFNPISHHSCAFPSADPAQGFECVNTTQDGKNSMIYGIPTNIETPAEGFNIYRVRYDGSQMEVMENVAETTGLGLGVHVCIGPKTAERYFVTGGQKDIAACFDRRTSRVIAAHKYDWEPNDRNLAMAWRNGGTLKISKIYPEPASKPRVRRSNGKWCRWVSCSSRRVRFPAWTRSTSAGPTARSGIRAGVGRRPSYGCAAASASSTPRTISSR